MVCGARVNLDLPARRLHTEWNEHKQNGGREEEEEEGCQASSNSSSGGGGIWLHLYHLSAPLFFIAVWSDSGWQDTCRTSVTRRTHLSDWECSGVVGGILVRRQRWNVKWTVFPFMLCQVVFQGKMEIPLCHMSNLAPYKLWNSFVKLGSNLNELQSGFGCISLRRICLWGRYGKMWQCVSSVLKVHLQPTCNLETRTYRFILLLSHLSAISAVFEDLLIFMLWGF